MQSNSYSYDQRKGVKPIEWKDFHAICKGLTLETSKFNPDFIVGIIRGGLYPAMLISHILQKEFIPIRITRRIKDKITYPKPQWILKPPITLLGQKVLIVDEICDSGETLELVKQEMIRIGVQNLKTAVLYSHKRAVHIPDYIGIITDELIINPWDREIIKEGKFITHPEYIQAIEMQRKSIEKDLFSSIEPIQIAKAP